MDYAKMLKVTNRFRCKDGAIYSDYNEAFIHARGHNMRPRHRGELPLILIDYTCTDGTTFTDVGRTAAGRELAIIYQETLCNPTSMVAGTLFARIFAECKTPDDFQRAYMQNIEEIRRLFLPPYPTVEESSPSELGRV